jgi:hypothetical protein
LSCIKKDLHFLKRFRKIHKYIIREKSVPWGRSCGRTDRERNKQDEANSRLSLFFSQYLKKALKSKEGIENIPFLHADLMSGQNTYTGSPLVDTSALYSERHEFNFHAEGQPFWISFGYSLVLFIVTSLPLPSWHFHV